MAEHALEVVVGPDGGVNPHDLRRLGVRPGDHLRIVTVQERIRKSFLGAFPREVGFTQEHLDELRSEMSEGLGDDLTA